LKTVENEIRQWGNQKLRPDEVLKYICQYLLLIDTSQQLHPHVTMLTENPIASQQFCLPTVFGQYVLVDVPMDWIGLYCTMGLSTRASKKQFGFVETRVVRGICAPTRK
jgi:hypothetical protein